MLVNFKSVSLKADDNFDKIARQMTYLYNSDRKLQTARNVC